MSSTPSIPGEAPFDPATLARMANAMFAALPGTASSSLPGTASSSLPGTASSSLPGTAPSALPGVANGLVPGAQFSVNVAPPASPLVSPAGFGPSVPGTPIPQGQIPGANVLPASPTQLPSLANRAPALLPHAVAGNGVPETALSVAPAFEPRLGSSVLGVPQQVNAPATLSAPSTPQANASPFYLLNNSFGHPAAGAAPAASAVSAVPAPPQVSPPLPLAGEGWGEGQRPSQGAASPLTPTSPRRDEGAAANHRRASSRSSTS